MATYRVTQRSYINGLLLEPGATVEYDGIPGSSLEPIDDAAHAAVAAKPAGRRPGMRSIDGKQPREPVKLPDRKLAEIPENWRELSQTQIITLARKLGAPAKGTGTQQATKWIEDELARRATA